jgi:hypothetical protein
MLNLSKYLICSCLAIFLCCSKTMPAKFDFNKLFKCPTQKDFQTALNGIVSEGSIASYVKAERGVDVVISFLLTTDKILLKRNDRDLLSTMRSNFPDSVKKHIKYWPLLENKCLLGDNICDIRNYLITEYGFPSPILQMLNNVNLFRICLAIKSAGSGAFSSPSFRVFIYYLIIDGFVFGNSDINLNPFAEGSSDIGFEIVFDQYPLEEVKKILLFADYSKFPWHELRSPDQQRLKQHHSLRINKFISDHYDSLLEVLKSNKNLYTELDVNDTNSKSDIVFKKDESTSSFNYLPVKLVVDTLYRQQKQIEAIYRENIEKRKTYRQMRSFKMDKMRNEEIAQKLNVPLEHVNILFAPSKPDTTIFVKYYLCSVQETDPDKIINMYKQCKTINEISIQLNLPFKYVVTIVNNYHRELNRGRSSFCRQ